VCGTVPCSKESKQLAYILIELQGIPAFCWLMTGRHRARA
jgi:hypothetical protein